MAGLVPTYIVEVELAGVGLGWTNLGATGNDDVLVVGMTMKRGIDGSGPADLMASTGHATFVLNNSTANSGGKLGYYSLYHANKRSGWDLGIRCRIRLIDPADASSHQQFIGRIDAINPIPGVKRERQVQVTAVDWLDDAATWNLTPDVTPQVNATEDEVLTAILAQMPTSPIATSFDAGSERYAYALDSSESTAQPALSEFAKLAASEVGPIYLKADGTLRAENRHTRMTATTVSWTIPDTSIQALEMPSTRTDILNTVRVTYHPKMVDAAPTSVIYQQANPIFVVAGATKDLLGPYRDQDTGDQIGGTDVQTLVSGTDYTANTSSDSIGTDLTASFSIAVTAGSSGARFTVTNGSATDGYLTTLQLLGKRVLDRNSVTVDASDATSITSYGAHVATLDMAYQDNAEIAQGAADYLLAKYKNTLALAQRITVVGKTTALLTQLLTREISDRIAISETVTGLSAEFFINAIEFTVLPGKQLQATYTLWPAQEPNGGAYFIIGTSALGGAAVLAPF